MYLWEVINLDDVTWSLIPSCSQFVDADSKRELNQFNMKLSKKANTCFLQCIIDLHHALPKDIIADIG